MSGGDHFPDAIDDKTLDHLLKIIHDFTGIMMSKKKNSMLQGRLRPRMRTLGITSYSEYLSHLEVHPEERQEFINLVTTNETYFFRTPRIWEYIEKIVLPEWITKKNESIFSVWSAAASSGEEAHTLAIVLQKFKEKHPHFQFQIHGTDISSEVLSYAIAGIYSGRSIEMFQKNQPELFNRYMKLSSAKNYSVASELHSKIVFQSYNLFSAPIYKRKFDLVLLRNVLIYFEAKDQEKVLKNVSHTIKHGGTLIIGEAESLNRLNTDYAYIQPMIYYLPQDETRKEAENHHE